MKFYISALVGVIIKVISFHAGFPVLMLLASVPTTKRKTPKHKDAVESALDLLPPILVGNW